MTETPLRTDALSWYPYSAVVEKQYEFVDRFGEVVQPTLHVGNILKVPRETAPIGVDDFRTTNFMGAINCKRPAKNDDQKMVIAKSLEFLKAGHNHIVEAPTGFGKTYVGSAVAGGLGQATLICVPKSDLMDQWHATLVNLIGIPPSQIGLIRADSCDYKGKQFVLGMVQSLMIPERYESGMYSHFGLLLFDETHRMAADCFQRVCQIFPAKYRLGLSATPKRSDGRDQVIKAHIGPVLVKGTIIPMSPKVIVQQSGWLMPRRKVFNSDKGEYESVPIPHAPGRMNGVVKIMAKSVQRNALLCNFIRQAYNAGRTTLVLSDLIENQLEILFFELIKSGVKAQDIGYYIGGKSKQELLNAANKRVILGTYKMVSEGTDYPHWDTLVYASPRAQVKQPVGRILRDKPGKVTPGVFDLVDADMIFKTFYKSRESQYYSLKATIVKK
jgi:superfamily II DNA or RNA helicase